MRLNRIALAMLIAAPVPMMANAGVTVSPILLGYHVSDSIEDTADKQRDVNRVGQQVNLGVPNTNAPLNGGVAKEDSLYTGAAIGVELTPSVTLELEYGQSNANGEASEKSASTNYDNVYDVKKEFYSGNFLIGSDMITGDYDSKLKPYLLVGAGQSKTEIEAKRAYNTNGQTTQNGSTGQIAAGQEVVDTDNTIANLGLGAMYRVTDTVSLRGEGRAIYNTGDEYVEGLALAGLNVVLGGHLAPSVPLPPPVMPVEVVEEPAEEVILVAPVTAADSDGDGVMDSVDKCPNTPMNAVVDADGCTKQVKLTDELKLELRVFYDINKSNIKDQYIPEIAKVAEKMREFPEAVANIEGHASKTGPKALNQRLSVARANSVKNMLVNRFSIAPNRITTEGFGYERPIAPNDTAEGRAMNRRTYAVITGSNTKVVDQTKGMNVQ